MQVETVCFLHYRRPEVTICCWKDSCHINFHFSGWDFVCANCRVLNFCAWWFMRKNKNFTAYRFRKRTKIHVKWSKKKTKSFCAWWHRWKIRRKCNLEPFLSTFQRKNVLQNITCKKRLQIILIWLFSNQDLSREQPCTILSSTFSRVTPSHTHTHTHKKHLVTTKSTVP